MLPAVYKPIDINSTTNKQTHLPPGMQTTGKPSSIPKAYEQVTKDEIK
jgi:hypothetical protein